MKDSYYFSHDSNALSDPKILSLRCDYGMEGYGIFWAIIEMLRNQDDYKLDLSTRTYKAIKMLCMTQLDIEKFINNCINEYELFVTDGEFFWSASLCKRMDKKDDVSEKRKKAIKSRWNKNKKEDCNTNVSENNDTEGESESFEDTNVIQKNTNVIQKNTNVIQNDTNVIQNDTKESKVKEKKEKESKEKESKENDKKKSESVVVNRVVKFYEQNIQAMPSPILLEELCSWLDEMDGDLIIKAMDIAMKAGKRRYDYICGILNNFLEKGFKTLEDYENDERIYEASKKAKNQNNANNTTEMAGNVFFNMLGGVANDS